MLLEDFAAIADQEPVLLTYGTLPAEAATLREVALRLADEDDAEAATVQIAELPGYQGIDRCSLLAERGAVKLGVVPIDEPPLAFRCALDPDGWRRVASLLEPFLTHRPTLNPNAFQYLDESGPIHWIISC